MQFFTSLRSLFIRLNPELSCAWDLKLQEQEQCNNQIQLFPSSLEEFHIWNLTDRVQSHLLSCLPAITKLDIWRSLELTSLELGCCTALKELAIGHCDSLASIEGLHLCRNLTSLKVINSLASDPVWSLCRTSKASGIWSGLETLEISDASVLSTPLCTQLTSLRCLQLSHRGLVSLTEEQETALQLLTSLHQFKFSNCLNLLSLPANLHRLTSSSGYVSFNVRASQGCQTWASHFHSGELT
ncbi:hypothetical protein ZWY2020_020552 [Hordeum vulgare]|nr:hypothetical protein ZWY2020_020552 [Hordeum vulgare]